MGVTAIGEQLGQKLATVYPQAKGFSSAFKTAPERPLIFCNPLFLKVKK